MFLPTLFVVASSTSVITMVVWIVIALIVTFVKNALKTGKNNAPKPKPQQATNQKTQTFNTRKHIFDTSSDPVDSTFGQDLNARSSNFQPITAEEPQSINEITENPQLTNKQIDLSSKEEIKKAVIYSEIFNRKY